MLIFQCFLLFKTQFQECEEQETSKNLFQAEKLGFQYFQRIVRIFQNHLKTNKCLDIHYMSEYKYLFYENQNIIVRPIENGFYRF